ncbi:Proteophosphoglycan ppg4 [Pleurotus pulmonarius]
MDSGEQGGASVASFPGSTTTAFAALTTILLATGSALYVRAKCTTSPLPNSTGMGVESTSATQVEAREHGEERNIQYSATHSDSRDSKTPRTKERRRRGKDPVKEIMKGSKKGNKLLLKLSQAAGDTSVPSSAASDIEFADDLTATSSTPERSRDTSVAKSRSTTSSSVVRTDPLPGDSPVPESAATPTPSSAFAATTPRATVPSTNGDARERDQALQVSPSAPSVDSTVHRNPPRFSKQSASPLLEPMFASGSSFEPSPSCSPPSSLSSVSLTSSSVSNAEDDGVPLTFPTLNSTNSFCQPSSPSPKVSALGPTEHIHGKGGTGPGNLNNELLSGNNTPPPSLSAQTQIASLRGALEAARLREDKMRLEMEKRTKDLDALRWENVTWRQREAEFQNQILHLTHHLQAYTALYASMSPQGHPPPPLPPGHHLQLPNMNGKSPHLRMSNTPSPAPSPTRLNVAPHVQGNIMLSPMPSPLSQSTHSHMFPYPAMSSPPTPGHPNQPPPSAPPSSSLFSVLFPYAGNQSNTAGGPSRSGRSSVGSMSPDLGAPGSPSQSAYNRGRQRARFWQGSEIDDWIETGGQSQQREAEGRAEEELNTVLADAILKRPDSIRRSGSQQVVDDGGQKESGEFTFPSLSGFGQAVRSTGTRSPEASSSNVDDADALAAPEALVPLPEDQGPAGAADADWSSIADLGRVGEGAAEAVREEARSA